MSTTELPEGHSAIPEPAEVQAGDQMAEASRRAASLMFGAQKLLLEELVFAGNEMLDRTKTEVHLFSEFISKMAAAHSVRDIRTMYVECTKHQIEYVRRDFGRVFKHSGRMTEAASSLFKSHP